MISEGYIAAESGQVGTVRQNSEDAILAQVKADTFGGPYKVLTFGGPTLTS